ncbi:MAG: tetratricopeptide repeat protein [Candidatus Omnitrophota bacterium]|jgi:tetratricopeptide (TPR) repeat protein
MEKINKIRFMGRGLAFSAILLFLPFFSATYANASDVMTITTEAEKYRTKGYEAQQLGDIDTAIEWYQKAANMRPEYAAPHNDLGILFETKGWLDRAEAEYEKALAIDPEYKEVHTNLALLCERKGELEKAAFHWMRRYKLGKAGDPWTEEARSRLEKLGLIDKAEKPLQEKIEKKKPIKKPAVKKEKPQAKPKIKKEKQENVKKDVVKKEKPEAKPKKGSDWTRIGSEKTGKTAKVSKAETKSSLDEELQESLRLAEERLKKEKAGKINTGEPQGLSGGEANAAYAKAKDLYGKGEYAKALDAIRLAGQDSDTNKALAELEGAIKFRMKEERIEDHYKEGMIEYRQKDFSGARKEFEAILSILPE